MATGIIWLGEFSGRYTDLVHIVTVTTSKIMQPRIFYRQRLGPSGLEGMHNNSKIAILNSELPVFKLHFGIIVKKVDFFLFYFKILTFLIQSTQHI